MNRMDAKLLILTFARHEQRVNVTLPEVYDFTMMTDGLVTWGLVKADERGRMEYQVERTGARFGADDARQLSQVDIKSQDRLVVCVRGEDENGRERRMRRTIRRLS